MSVSLDVTNGVAEVVLERPPVNAFDDQQLAQFRSVVQSLEGRDDVAVVIVRGAGQQFCAGADIESLQTDMATDPGVERLVALAEGMQRSFDQLSQLPVPTVAALHGAALGGGLELAMACDLRVASRSARLGLPEVRLGLLAAAGGTQRLPAIIGRSQALRMMFTGEIVDGRRAHDIGLVEWYAEDDEFEAEVTGVIEAITRHVGPAQAAIKRCVDARNRSEGLGRELLEQRVLHRTTQSHERITAFFTERRR